MFATAPFRAAARLLQQVRRFVWRFTGKPRGVHAVALTPAGRVVLVKLTYAPGWRPPGGGYKKSESAAQAVLRELEEEIGMTDHSALEEAVQYRKENPDGRGSLFIARGVRYRPRRSLEVAEVREFDPGDLPPEVPERWRSWIERLAR